MQSEKENVSQSMIVNVVQELFLFFCAQEKQFFVECKLSTFLKDNTI